MPMQRKWKTWDLVATDIDAETTHKSLVGSAMYRRHPDLAKGLCLGATLRWCRRHLRHPNETAFERVGHLEKNRESIAAVQSLSNETFTPASIELHKWRIGGGKIFESLSRASRLRFDYVFTIPRPDDGASMSRLFDVIDSDRVYFWYLDGKHYPKGLQCFTHENMPVHWSHVVALDTRDRGLSKVFDTSFGEFEVGKYLLGRFLCDYVGHYRDAGYLISELHIHEVSQIPAAWSHRPTVEVGPPPGHS